MNNYYHDTWQWCRVFSRRERSFLHASTLVRHMQTPLTGESSSSSISSCLAYPIPEDFSRTSREQLWEQEDMTVSLPPLVVPSDRVRGCVSSISDRCWSCLRCQSWNLSTLSLTDEWIESLSFMLWRGSRKGQKREWAIVEIERIDLGEVLFHADCWGVVVCKEIFLVKRD